VTPLTPRAGIDATFTTAKEIEIRAKKQEIPSMKALVLSTTLLS
jgi:hypothetical protein